jgi:hypothetical protein
MEDLIDQGIVSSDVAAAWYAIKDNAYETVEAEIELGIATSQLSEAMDGVIKNAATMGRALISNEVAINTTGKAIDDLYDSERDLFDVYTEGEHAGDRVIEVLMNNIGVWDSFGGSMEGVVENLESFYGMSLGSILSEYGQAGIISAAAMVQMGQSVGVWEEGMTEAALAAELGIDNLAAFRSTAAGAWDVSDDGVNTLADINNALLRTNSILESTEQAITDALTKITALQGTDLKSMEVAIEIAFSETAAEQNWLGDFEGFLQDLEENKVEFSPELTGIWDKADFDAFTRIFGEDTLSRSFKKSLQKRFGDLFSGIPENVDQWDWENWKHILNTDDAAGGITETFKGFGTLLSFDSEWDGQDWYTWQRNLGSKKNQVKSIFSDFSSNFELTTTWDGNNWTNFLNSVPTELIPALVARLREAGVELPFEVPTTDITTDVEGITFTLDDLTYTVDENGIVTQIENATDTASPQVVEYNMVPSDLTPEQIKSLFESLSDEDKARFLLPTTPLSITRLFLPGSLDIVTQMNLKIGGGLTGEQIIEIIDAGDVPKDIKMNFLWGNASEDVKNMIIAQANLFGGSESDIGDGVTRTVTAEIDDQVTDVVNNTILPTVNKLEKTVTTTHVIKTVTEGGSATGAIAGLAAGIAETRGPMFSMIGERGPEAVVPLAGLYKERGRDILEHIIPKFFPEMTRQAGGISNIDNSSREEYNILGPVTVNGVANVGDMAEEFKYRYRSSR